MTSLFARDETVARARREALDTLGRIASAGERHAQTRRRRADRLFAIVAQGRRNGMTPEINRKLNDAIRKIHDSLGWKALGELAKSGLCAGALYRSKRYLAALESGSRSGAKNTQTVHIEHTVKIGSLIRALQASEFPSAIEQHDFLIRHSVCAGVHIDEKGPLDSESCTGVDRAGRTMRFPFARYGALARTDREFVIVNVIKEVEVDPSSFTFADHLDTLEQAMAMIRHQKAVAVPLYFLG